MNFVIEARVSAKRFSYHRSTLLSALEHGMSLQAAGMADVRIIDGCGRERSPAEVQQLLFGLRSAVKAAGSDAERPSGARAA
ncbi:hypothetical protein [Methylorubrum extorquens]